MRDIIINTWHKVRDQLGICTGVVVFLMSIAALFHSSLVKAGFFQLYPIGILYDNDATVRMLYSKICCRRESHPTPLGHSLDKLPSEMTASRDDLLLLFFRGSRGSTDSLQYIEHMIQEDYRTIPCVIAVCFNNYLPTYSSSSFLLCELPICCEEFPDMTALIYQLQQYAEKNEDRILLPLEEYHSRSEFFGNHAHLYATAHLLSRMISTPDEGAALYKELTCALDEAISKSQDIRRKYDAASVFIRRLKEFIESDSSRVVPRASRSCAYSAHEAILYDEAHCYIPDEIFTLVCSLIGSNVDTQIINNALNLADVQIPERDGKGLKNTQSIPVWVNDSSIRARYHVIRMDSALLSVIQHKAGDGGEAIPEEENELIHIGYTTDNIPAFTSSRAENHHFAVTGMTGTGKTAFLFLLENCLACKGDRIIVLNYANSHDTKFIPPALKDNYEENVHRVDLSAEGVPFSLWPSESAATGNEYAVNILSTAFGFTAKQNDALLQALNAHSAANRGRYRDELQAVVHSLEDYMPYCGKEMQTALCAVSKKLSAVSSAIRIVPRSTPCGCITILNLDYDTDTSSTLSNLILLMLFQEIRCHGSDSHETFVVLDEFQHLNLSRDDMPVPLILREGRRYGLSAILATQTLGGFSAKEKSLVNQAATKIFFKQTSRDACEIARSLPEQERQKMVESLTSLDVGHFIADGTFFVGSLQKRGMITLMTHLPKPQQESCSLQGKSESQHSLE